MRYLTHGRHCGTEIFGITTWAVARDMFPAALRDASACYWLLTDVSGVAVATCLRRLPCARGICYGRLVTLTDPTAIDFDPMLAH